MLYCESRLHSFLWLKNISWINIPHFVYPFISWYMFRLPLLLTMMNDTAVSILVQVSVWTYVFSSLGYVPKEGMLDHRVTLCLIF